MPCVVGVFKVNSNDGIFINGDTFIVSPTSTSKSNQGAGGGINGDFSLAISVFSSTVTYDPDVNDSNVKKVATAT